MTRPGACLVVAAALLVASSACGRDGGQHGPGSVTVGGSIPTATPGTGPQPTPIPLTPVLPNGVRSLGQGYRTFALEAGVGAELDTIQAARDAGVTPPSCAGFVFAMHWSVDGPGARNARVESVVQGTAAEVGTGPEGRATVGCTLLRLTATDTAFLNLAFAIGASQ